MVTQYDPTALSSLNVDEKKLSEILEGNIANGCIRTLIRIIQDTYYPGGVIIAGPRLRHSKLKYHLLYCLYLHLRIRMYHVLGSHNTALLFNNYWMRFSMIAKIIKAKVCVICRRLRRITETLIILAIMRKPNSIIVLVYNYQCRSL